MSKQMEERVALLGLSKAGKTTLVEQLAHADPIKITTPPTTPPDGTLHTHNPTDNMMMVSLSGPASAVGQWITRPRLTSSRDVCAQMIWDMCGDEKARRGTWPDQCIMASSIMFVIDCSSPASMHVARDELYKVLSHEELNPHAPLLVWANKMDVIGSSNETKVAEFLALEQRGDCAHRQWCVQGSVMHDHAKGLDHGLKWLYLALQQKPDKKKWKPGPPELIPNDVQAEVITPVRCARNGSR